MNKKCDLPAMLYLILVLFGVYFLSLLILAAGFQKAISFSYSKPKEGSKPFLSVIVPFRNEEKNLAKLVSSLSRQEYGNFEVILVDDNSTDNSFQVCTELINRYNSFRVIKTRGSGKKSAITDGVRSCNGEIVVTTDADCVLQPEWLAEIVRGYAVSKLQFLFGGVKLSAGDSWFERLQQLEFTSVVGTGIAAFGLGTPLYCNGANLSFRKDAFFKVGGYDGNLDIPSGDDEFLLKKMHESFKGQILFLPAKDAIVEAAPSKTIGEFIHQRLRWAGKWRHTPGLASKFMAIFMILVQLAVLLSVTLTFRSDVLPYLLGVKVLFEFVFLFMVCQFLEVQLKLIDFIALQLIYPFYVLGIGVFSNFCSYNWKGRRG